MTAETSQVVTSTYMKVTKGSVRVNYLDNLTRPTFTVEIGRLHGKYYVSLLLSNEK